MSLFRDLFSANFALSPLQRQAIRTSLRRWGGWLGLLILTALVLIGYQDPSPEQGRTFDVVWKVSFAIMRLCLATIGLFLGIFLGYVAYQIIESSRAGSQTTRFDDSDSEAVKQVKVLNRGFLLTLLVAMGGLVMALALSGAGGR